MGWLVLAGWSPVPLQNVPGFLTRGFMEWFMQLTRANLARRHPPSLASLAVDDPSFLQAARPMSAIGS
jgi:hypothetical protein